MARPHEEYPLDAKLLRLYRGDFETLGTLYPKFSVARIIRNLVRAHIRRIEEMAAQTGPMKETIEINIAEILEGADVG